MGFAEKQALKITTSGLTARLLRLEDPLGGRPDAGQLF